MLIRCTAAGELRVAGGRQESHVFRVAAMVMRPRFPAHAARLMQAANAWFAGHPGEILEADEVMRQGWLSSLPRLRDMLSRRLQQG